MQSEHITTATALLISGILAASIGGRWPATAALSAQQPAQPATDVTVDVVDGLGGRVSELVARAGHIYVGEGMHIVVYAVSPDGAMIRVGRSAMLPNTPADLALHDAFLYATTQRELQTFDVSDPERPRWLASTTVSTGGGMAVSGNTLVIGARGAQAVISLLDVSQSAQPRVVARVLPLGWDGVLDLLVDGTRLVASGYGSKSGIQLFDITNPAQPTALGWAYGNVGALANDGDIVYSGGDRALELWNIADPTNPSRLGSLEVQGGVDQIVRAGNMLATQGSEMSLRLHLFDVADPRHPVPRAALTGTGIPAGLAFDGRALFAAYNNFGRGGGVSAINVADPAKPRVTDEVVLAGWPVATVADGTSLIVLTSAKDYGTHGISIAAESRCEGLTVQQIHRLRQPYFDPYRAAVTPSATWMVGRWHGDIAPFLPKLQAISHDLSTEFGLIDIGQTNEMPAELAHFGNTLYVTGDAGLIVVDGSDPNNPRIVAHQAVDVDGMAVSGDIMAAIIDKRLRVGRIVDPLALPELKPVDDAFAADSMALSGTMLYMRTGSQLRQYTVADPAAPRIVAIGQAGEGSLFLAADDGVLAAWGYSHWVNVFTTFGDTIGQVGTLNLPTGTLHVTVDQDRIFAALADWGLVEARVIGVGAPGDGVPRGTYRTFLPAVSVGCATVG